MQREEHPLQQSRSSRGERRERAERGRRGTAFNSTAGGKLWGRTLDPGAPLRRALTQMDGELGGRISEEGREPDIGVFSLHATRKSIFPSYVFDVLLLLTSH